MRSSPRRGQDQAAGGDAGARGDQHGAVAGDLVDRGAADLAYRLGEAYIHGMNGIAEAVRQVRGTSVNQVPGDGPVLVTAGTGVPTSGLILGPA